MTKEQNRNKISMRTECTYRVCVVVLPLLNQISSIGGHTLRLSRKSCLVLFLCCSLLFPSPPSIDNVVAFFSAVAGMHAPPSILRNPAPGASLHGAGMQRVSSAEQCNSSRLLLSSACQFKTTACVAPHRLLSDAVTDSLLLLMLHRYRSRAPIM